MIKSIPTAIITAACLLTSCSESNTNNKPSKASAIPAKLFTATKPQVTPLSVVEAKTLADGSDVTVIGDIGGYAKGSFGEKFAIFTLADQNAIISCNKKEDDNCKTPWDYCCEELETINNATLSVQIIGQDGKVIKESLRGANGLKELSHVVISGKILKKGDATLINASSIYIER